MSDAREDGEHILIYIDINTDILDRTRALLANGPDPLPQLATSAKKLEGMGADLLIISCNTAHCFFDRLAPQVDIPILSMIDTTAKEILSRGIRKVGLLATDGVIRSQLYESVLTRLGVTVLLPDAVGQQEVMKMIYTGIKAGDAQYDPAAFVATAKKLVAYGAKALLLGCTKVSLAFSRLKPPFATVDPTLTLAKAAVLAAGFPPTRLTKPARSKSAWLGLAGVFSKEFTCLFGHFREGKPFSKNLS